MRKYLNDYTKNDQQNNYSSDSDSEEVRLSEQTNQSNIDLTTVATGLLAAGTIAAVAATTKVHTDNNGISSTTDMGPFKSSGYVKVENGTLYNGTEKSTDLGPVGSTSESHHSTFGKKGVGESNSEAWNLGGNKHGVGTSESHESMWTGKGHTQSHTHKSNLFGLKSENTTTTKVGHGNIFSHQEEGKIFGKEYHWGLNIPTPKAPNLSKIGSVLEPVGKALKPVGKVLKPAVQFFKEAGPTIGHRIGVAVHHAPEVAEGALKVVNTIAKALPK